MNSTSKLFILAPFFVISLLGMARGSQNQGSEGSPSSAFAQDSDGKLSKGKTTNGSKKLAKSAAGKLGPDSSAQQAQALENAMKLMLGPAQAAQTALETAIEASKSHLNEQELALIRGRQHGLKDRLDEASDSRDLANVASAT